MSRFPLVAGFVGVVIYASTIFLGSFNLGSHSNTVVGVSSPSPAPISSPVVVAKLSLTPSPSPTLNADLASGIVIRFYRDLNISTVSSFKDLLSITSRDFHRDHSKDMIIDYALISDPKIQITSVGDRSVNYVLDYIYKSKNKSKIFWQRTGTWTFNHGSQSGWVLDNDKWDSIHIIGLQDFDKTSMTSVQDVVYNDGRHEFDYMGTRLSFFAGSKGWSLSPVSIPVPTPTPTISSFFVPKDSTDSSSNSVSTDTPTDINTSDPAPSDSTSSEITPSQTTETHFDDSAIAQAKCPTDIVVWVNTNTGVFHYPGRRWYGATRSGTYECKNDAINEGDRPSMNGQ